MIIDKLGSRVYTEHELTDLAQFEIRSKYSAAAEDNLSRKLRGVALGVYTLNASEQLEVEAYKNHLYMVQTETAQAVIDNQLLADTIAYENATVRLQQYEPAIGRPETVIYKPDSQDIDYVIPAIDPLPATVEKVVTHEDLSSEVVQVPNPLIEADTAERLAAQAIVNAVSGEVLALHELRKGT